MSSTPSTLMKLQLPDIGTEDDTWGDILNDNVFSRLEQAVHGEAAIAVLGSNITLDDTQYLGTESHKSVLKLTGAQTADIDLVVPARTHNYIVLNDTTDGGGGPWTVTVKVTGQTGVAMAHGEHMILYANGTDVEKIFSGGDYQPLATKLTALGALSAADGQFAVGNGSTFVGETGATARASLGIDGASKVLVAGDYGDGTVGAGALANTAVNPGDYTLSSFTVDQQGRVTAASSGTSPFTDLGGQTLSGASEYEWPDAVAIPATAKIIDFFISGGSLSGTDYMTLMLGDASAYASSGYSGAINNHSQTTTNSTFFYLHINQSASIDHFINVRIARVTGNTYSVNIAGMNSTGSFFSMGGGSVTLTGDLTRFKIGVTGSNTYDGGTAYACALNG